MSDISSMREGWAPHIQRANKGAEELIAGLDQWAAGVEGAPVHPSVVEAAREVATLARQIPEKIANVNALTKQADAASWQHTEAMPGRPNPQAWN